MSKIRDISHPAGMTPKIRYAPEIDDNIINVDGAIEMIRKAGTENSRAMYKAFRAALSRIRELQPSLSPEKQREEALFQSFKDLGIKTTDAGRISGTMDSP